MPFKILNRDFLKRFLSSRTFAFWGILSGSALWLGALLATDASAISGTRAISFYNPHSKQNLTVTYKRYGQYIPSAMRKLNYILRDWRTDQVVRMDPKLIDLLWEIHTGLKSRKPISVLSGYRSPKTNAMLRGRSRGVSRVSRHMFGMAMDVRFPDVSVEKLRDYAMRKQGGGVGYYRGNFVHVDVGSVRHWPRMSRRQLARLFPKGKSLHVPRGVARPIAGRVASRPLPRPTVVSRPPSGVIRGAPPSRIAAPAEVRLASLQPKKQRRRVLPRSRLSVRLARNVPVPRSKPAFVVASATPPGPIINGSVPLPQANPVVLARRAQRAAPTSQFVVASASGLATQQSAGLQNPATGPQKEVAVARPVANSVEVITARPVQPRQVRRSLFGLAKIAPSNEFNNNLRSNGGARIASAYKTSKQPLSDGLVNVNRKLKGDRLISQAALETKRLRIRLAAANLDEVPEITAAVQKQSPFSPPEPDEDKNDSNPFGLLSALFPMFAGKSDPVLRKRTQ